MVNEKEPGKLLTIDDVKNKLKISERTVHRMCDTGKLKKIKLGDKSVRITENSLNKFINESIHGSYGNIYDLVNPQSENEKFAFVKENTNDPIYISVVNHKGGVGKSELVKEIGAYFTLKHKNVLLVDCDPQGNLSSDFDWYPISEEGEFLPQLLMVYDKSPMPLKDVVRKTNYKGLDIIPNSVLIINKEQELNSRMYREELLKRYFRMDENADYVRNYDYVIFDNPPSGNIFVTNSLIASDFYLVPVQATKKALDGTFSFQAIIEQIKEETNIHEIGKVMTFWDNTRKEPREVEDRLKRELQGYVFNTRIRNLADISSERVPKVFSTKKNSEARSDMLAFCEELEDRLNILINSTIPDKWQTI